MLDDAHATGFHPAAELRALYDEETDEGEEEEEEKKKAGPTLVFRCTSWRLSTRFLPQPVRLGTQLPVLDTREGRLRLEGLPSQMEDVAEEKEEKAAPAPSDLMYVFATHAILPPVAVGPTATRALLIERLLSRHADWFPADAKQREHVLDMWERMRKTFGLAVWKSTLQKLIRFGARTFQMPDHATRVPMQQAVAMTSILLITHPGALLPDLHAYITGLVAFLKRLVGHNRVSRLICVSRS